jgi:hypothetical protein
VTLTDFVYLQLVEAAWLLNYIYPYTVIRVLNNPNKLVFQLKKEKNSWKAPTHFNIIQ